jgi:hypothetical protein
MFRSRFALIAGGTPAVPVQSLNDYWFSVGSPLGTDRCDRLGHAFLLQLVALQNGGVKT